MINQGSREGEANDQAASDHLNALGVDVVHGEFQEAGQLSEEIAQKSGDVDVIVLGGGDGTLNLAAKSVMDAGKPMAVLPLGTANDFARTLMIPNDLEGACTNVVQGVEHGIDLGQCNDVYFVNVASIGLAVRACEYRSDTAKKWFGSFGYVSNVFQAVRDTKPFGADIRFNGRHERLHSIQIAIGNGRYFGGGLPVSSEAALDSGRLDVYSLKPQPLWSLLGSIPGLLRGPDKSMQGVQLFDGVEFQITTDRPMDINTDGEILTATPATFCVLPGALRVKVPQAYIDHHSQEARAGDSAEAG